MTKEEYIKKYNLIATKTIKNVSTLYDYNFNIDNYDINYDKSLNVFNLLDEFNILHYCIQSDYDSFEKINIAKDMDIYSYKCEDNVEIMQFLLRYPNFDIYNKGTIAYLNLYGTNDTYYANITSESNSNDYVDVDINPYIIMYYLYLGRTYTKLISSYRELKRYFGKSYFEGEINFGLMLNGDLLSKINYYKLSFGLTKVDFDIVFDDHLSIKDIKKYNDKLDFKDNDIIEIARSIYMSKKIIKDIIPSNRVKEKQKTKTL